MSLGLLAGWPGFAEQRMCVCVQQHTQKVQRDVYVCGFVDAADAAHTRCAAPSSNAGVVVACRPALQECWSWPPRQYYMHPIHRRGQRPEWLTGLLAPSTCISKGLLLLLLLVRRLTVGLLWSLPLVAFCCCLAGWCRLDQLGAAQQLFNEMHQQGCQPTHSTFIMLLQSAESHGQAHVAVTLLKQMQAMQLCLTPQCYAAAIGACAAAGQLTTARKLLSDMMSSSKAGMAAPAHIIIQLQDKCCDWAAAFGTYQKLIASNVRPDKQTTATAIEALWSAGHVGSCLLALKVFHASCKQGLFKADASLHPSEPIIEFVVPGAGTSMAIVGLWTLLVEMRVKVVREGAGFLCRHVVLLLGDVQAQMPQLKQAMAQVSVGTGL